MNDVKEIDLHTAKTFISKWHYTHKCPTGKNIFYGIYVNNYLYAVSCYGDGSNPYQSEYLSKLTNINIQKEKLIELRRLCRIEPGVENVYLSQFLSKCHKLLKKAGYKYVVTFSDPKYSHTGTLYKASNFTYLGKTKREYHILNSDGTISPRNKIYRYAKRHNIPPTKAVEILGVEFIRTTAKDRWFIKI